MRGVSFAGVVITLLVVFLKGFFVESFFVPSSSMTPTIEKDDYILVPKFLYGLRIPLLNEVVVRWGEPQRGDVIVFRKRESATDETVVKRVIALGGDSVEIVGSQVFLNGEALVEPYVQSSKGEGTEYHFGPYRVPSNKVFVLGDNRDNSEDSRAWPDPFISVHDVIGKAVMVYWSGHRDRHSGVIF